jgi:hypothetical protein
MAVRARVFLAVLVVGKILVAEENKINVWLRGESVTRLAWLIFFFDVSHIVQVLKKAFRLSITISSHIQLYFPIFTRSKNSHEQ